MENRLIVGVDEAGRGCLAGPVVAAAFVAQGPLPKGLNDSKKLTPRQRDALYEVLTNGSHLWSVGMASVEEIDRLNILQATMLAMRRAVEALALRQPMVVWVDGNQCPLMPGLPEGSAVHSLVHGDALMPAISAASVLAKVSRDRYMVELAKTYPGYGFDVHKGYGTVAHMKSLWALGPCKEHRQSFEPVRRSQQEQNP